MSDRFKVFVALGLYWMVFFTAARIIFFIYHTPQTIDLSAYEVAMPLILGMRMDAAMAGYWLILPGLMLAASVWLKSKVVYNIINSVTLFLLIFSTIIIVVDLELYRHWGFRMNTTPLMYAGSEGAGSAGVAAMITLPIIFLSMIVGFAWLYFKTVAWRIQEITRAKPLAALALFALTLALFIPIRSSFTVAPLNTGVVFFDRDRMYPNHAGINVVWNFLKSLTTENDLRYTEDFFPLDEAKRNLSMAVTSDSTTHLLTDGKPNIILIVLESFTAKIVAPLGGLPEVTPRLNKFYNEGIGFMNFYSSGDRTDKGIVTILSGYPAQPKTSIIKFTEKTQSLPFLPQHLKKLGYSPTFVYGGDIGFANMESYATMAGFDHITEYDDFDEEESKWGIHDGFVFKRLLEECDTAAGPFFKVMLSLSSHEPFDVPHRSQFSGQDEVSLFLNACHYTDSSLGGFIDAAKKKSWWQNTVVIITADHGHRYPDPAELNDHSRFKIPMLWIGGAIKTETTIDAIGSQTDIANTILGQVNHTQEDFLFSKDLLNPSLKPFAVYVFNNGYGYIDEYGENTYDFDLKNYIRNSSPAEALKLGQSYMQVLFSDYNQR